MASIETELARLPETHLPEGGACISTDGLLCHHRLQRHQGDYKSHFHFLNGFNLESRLASSCTVGLDVTP